MAGKRRTPQNKGGTVTIKDLAADLNLSITTISRGLNGYSDVGPETRKRVVAAAERLGYRPNRNAQRLVTKRTHLLAWVQSDHDRRFIDPHLAEVMAGVLRGSRERGYDLLLTGDRPDKLIAVFDRYLRDNSVDGFILDLPQHDDARISFLLDHHRPFVVHGREVRKDRYGWVDIDNYGIFRDLTRLMVLNGHQDIALINGDERFTFASSRRQGAEDALEELGLPRERLRVFNALHPMGDAGFQLTSAALEDPKVSAIIYSSALMAVEGQPALVRAGRKPGSSIAIASMDDELHYIDLSPFSGVISYAQSSLAEAGVEIAEELIRQCEGDLEPRGTLVPHRFNFAHDVDGTVLGEEKKAAAS